MQEQRVQITNSSRLLIILFAAMVAFGTCARMSQYQQENELRAKQLEYQKKQYALDSLRFEYMKMHKK
jgi:hypothetical protein